MASHRYWRIYITETRTGDQWWATLAEIDLRGSSGGADIASGGTASASSYDLGGGGRVPANAFDNSASTLWVSLVDELGPQWIAYDLGSSQNVAEVMLQSGDTSGRAARAPRDFEVQWSDDGSSWTTIHEVDEEAAWSTGETRVYTFASAASILRQMMAHSA